MEPGIQLLSWSCTSNYSFTFNVCAQAVQRAKYKLIWRSQVFLHSHAKSHHMAAALFFSCSSPKLYAGLHCQMTYFPRLLLDPELLFYAACISSHLAIWHDRFSTGINFHKIFNIIHCKDHISNTKPVLIPLVFKFDARPCKAAPTSDYTKNRLVGCHAVSKICQKIHRFVWHIGKLSRGNIRRKTEPSPLRDTPDQHPRCEQDCQTVFIKWPRDRFSLQC